MSTAKTPLTTAYCHCSDCRRWTGAPVAAFAAFAVADVSIDPIDAVGTTQQDGAQRFFCKACGSPLAATFDYLPDQIYVPIGVIDQASELPPEVHSHVDSALPWLHIEDDVDRISGSGRVVLNSASE